MSLGSGYSHRTTVSLVAAAVLVLGAGLAQAQVGYSGERQGHWEFSLSPLYQSSNNIDFEGGTTVDIDSELGWELGFGYNLTDQFNLGFGFDWYSPSYDANVVTETGSLTRVTGDYSDWVMYASGTWNMMEGPWVPYLTAQIGYSYIDTGIPSGLPQNVCWWDPWYGYICGTTYPTKTSDSFTYGAGLGVRFQVNPSFYMRAGYDMRWMDIGKATSTPSFDQFRLDFGWMF
jgi:opacity protein-like surface antigen